MNRGFTLIEIMVSVAISVVITGTIALVLQSGMEAWRYGQERLAAQKVFSDVMDLLTEGGYDEDGIKDATEIVRAGPHSFTFVSLWRDDSQRPDPRVNPEQRFTMNRQYKAGSSLPLGQIRKRGTYDWKSVPVKFYYGEGNDPADPDDQVVFVDTIPPIHDVRILFKPDALADPTVAKTFSWEEGDQRIYSTFDGKTTDMLKHDKTTKIEYLKFIYYDGLNQLVEVPAGETTLPQKDLNRVTAVKVYLRVRKGPEVKEQTSFINIRSTLGGGIAITEGTVIPMPNSQDIRAFYIGNFQGVKGPATLELDVEPKMGTIWRVRLDLAPAGKEDMVLTNFSIQYPPGTPVFSDRPYKRFSARDSLNLLTIDRSGRYDYDDDEDMRDFVNVRGEGVFLTIRRMDMDGANIYIKP